MMPRRILIIIAAADEAGISLPPPQRDDDQFIVAGGPQGLWTGRPVSIPDLSGFPRNRRTARSFFRSRLSPVGIASALVLERERQGNAESKQTPYPALEALLSARRALMRVALSTRTETFAQNVQVSSSPPLDYAVPGWDVETKKLCKALIEEQPYEEICLIGATFAQLTLLADAMVLSGSSSRVPVLVYFPQKDRPCLAERQLWTIAFQQLGACLRWVEVGAT